MDVARLVLQIMGGGSTVEPPVPAVSPGNETASDPVQSLEHDTIHKSGLELPAQAVRLSKETVSVAQKPANAEEGNRIVAEGAEHCEVSRSAAPQQAVRRHGSAKPLV
jgi:creatinine amidohydrolase/Fe(II)-dependent formamide hydrolase-like protein